MTSTPLNGRIRFTYPMGMSSLSFPGVSADITAEQAAELSSALRYIQSHSTSNVYVISETLLTD